MHCRRRHARGLVLAVLMIPGGCTARFMAYRVEDYALGVKIDPGSHHLRVEAQMVVTRLDQKDPDSEEPVTVRFELHPALRVTRAAADDVRILQTTRRRGKTDGDAVCNVHAITIDRPVNAFRLHLDYEGTLTDDVQAGQEPDAIHNWRVRAHVDEEGVYLSRGGRWYPVPVIPAGVDPAASLSNYHIEVASIEGFVFAAGADSLSDTTDTKHPFTAASAFPMTDLVLTGGRLQNWSRTVDGIRFRVLLRGDDVNPSVLNARAETLLADSVRYVQRYQPLIGPYPYGELKIVENFFSSGFAFPTLILFGPRVVSMCDRGPLRHGYLDHEILHSWWGNSVFVHPDDGNWCEALASFGGNHYGFELDGDPPGARAYRRDICNGLSRGAGKENKPLGTFGLPDGAGRGIGYGKGALVFHMLSRVIGTESFWAAIRTLGSEHTGEFADWTSLQAAFQEHASVELAPFFDTWVRRGAEPEIRLAAAWMNTSADSPADRAFVQIEQGPTPFQLDLPLRIIQENGEGMDVIAHISQSTEHVQIDGVRPPATVQLDPDYHVVRRLNEAEIMPTLAGTMRGTTCHLLVGTTGQWTGYEKFGEGIRKRRPDNTTSQSVLDPSQTTPLPNETLAVAGLAARCPAFEALLNRSECPLKIDAQGFQVDGDRFEEPGHAVLATFRHPDAPERTVSVYYGNSETALANADLLWFYSNSLLVFETRAGAAGQAEPETQVVHRVDLERPQQLVIEANSDA